ncbi:uncharacterized protein LOC115707442 [Cannabis sativa]|uniref:uncharacterized protein LOC115707442 n=1 Tax=Cannabis sativa TaxID=3483 RepID=UPI0029C9B7C6|nr:uncharacterized protein LOC115707442 [Cannabis sativa]
MLKPRFFRLFGREKPVRKVFSIDFLLIVEGWFSPIDFWRKGGKSFHQSSGWDLKGFRVVRQLQYKLRLLNGSGERKIGASVGLDFGDNINKKKSKYSALNTSLGPIIWPILCFDGGCETRFNRLDRNEDAPSVCRYLSVFNSQSRPLTSGLIKPLDHISRDKAEWCILQNSPEIQAYLDEHLDKIRHEYPNGNHDVLHRQTFRPWFHKKIHELHKLGTLQNGDELLALASGSDYLATFYEGCVVNGVRFIASKRDQKRKTQNSGVLVLWAEGFNYYGTLEDVITISYTGAYTVSLFECKWYNTNPLRKKTITENNITSINTRGYWYQDEPYILANQAKQVFYLEDPLRGRDWKVVEDISHRQIWDITDNEDETDVDVVSDSNSANFVLTVDLGELIMQSNEPPVIVESSDQLVDSEIENNELDENYVAEEVDDLLVEHVEDENVNLVNDGNDSDSSV